MSHETILTEIQLLLRTDPSVGYERIKSELLECTTPSNYKCELNLLASRSQILVGKYEEGIGHAQEALSMAKELDNRRFEGLALNELGIYSFIHYDFSQAYLFYGRAQQLLDRVGTECDQAKVLTNIGNVAMRQSRYFDSAQAYGRALELLEGGVDVHTETKVLMNLSSLYDFVMLDTDTAREYTQRAIALFRMLSDTSGLAKALTNLAQIFRRNGEAVESISLFKEALALRQNYAEPVDLALNYAGLALALLESHQYEDAQAVIDEGELRLETLSASELTNYLLQPKAVLLQHQGRHTQALEAIDSMLMWTESKGIDEYRITLDSIKARILSDLGEYKNATEMLFKISEMTEQAQQQQAKNRLIYAQQQIENARDIGKEQVERLRNTELAQTVRRLEAAVAENEEYMAFLAHELKTPLSTIRSVAGMLATDVDVTSQEGKEYSVEILSIATRMLNMVTRVLAGSKIHMSHKYTAVDARNPLHHVVSSASIRAREKKIYFDSSVPNEPVLVDADDQTLHMVFENIVSNAIKFTPREGVVKVSLKISNPADDRPSMLLSVLDTGPGLSESDKLSLYQAFVPLGAKPTNGESSTGLGLHLVRRAVDQLGARLWCESEHGNGSIFFFELPLANNDFVNSGDNES